MSWKKFTEYKTSKFQLKHLYYETQLIHYEQNNEVDMEKGNENQYVTITLFVWPLLFMMRQKHENRCEKYLL